MAGGEIRLKITGLAHGGAGMARLDNGMVVFVDGALPGELVNAAVYEKKRDFLRARTVCVLRASADRVEPECPHFAECGGCALMFMRPDSQVSWKNGLFANAVKRIFPSAVIKDPVSGPSLGYRSRARFRYSISDGRPVLGFCAGGSDSVVNVSSCPVLDAPLNSFLAHPPRLNVWELENRQLSCITTDGGVLYNSRETGWITVNAGAAGLRRLPVSTDVFFQSNLLLLPELVGYVVELVSSCTPAGGRVLDLYSGVGTFSAFFEDRFDVTAVELNARCLSLARLHLHKTKFFSSAVEKWRPAAPAGAENTGVGKADVVIVDPPRTGLAALVPQALVSLKPSCIVYVSCFLPTLSRDLERFARLGYYAETARMFDFYPNTPHLETVVMMSRERK